MELNIKYLLEQFLVDPKIIDNIGYFDLLSLLTPTSLHPGGLDITAKTIDIANLKYGDKVLEIGCGTGTTTTTLSMVGLNITVIEKNLNLLNSTQSYCKKHCNNLPRFILGDVCEIDNFNLNYNEFDAILFECVIGFIKNKKDIINNVKKYLKPYGKIIICDMHYNTIPNNDILEKISYAVDWRFEVLYENDWLNLFNEYKKVYWEKFELVQSTITNINDIKNLLKFQYPEIDFNDYFCDKINEKMNSYKKLFNSNKLYCNGHIGIFS